MRRELVLLCVTALAVTLTNAAKRTTPGMCLCHEYFFVLLLILIEINTIQINGTAICSCLTVLLCFYCLRKGHNSHIYDRTFCHCEPYVSINAPNISYLGLINLLMISK